MRLLGPDEKNPGGDLLLRDLSSDYHWRGSVSLPGSERDRVGPLRSGHRASGGRGFFSLHPACPGALGGFEGDFLRGCVCLWLRRFPLVMRGRNQRKLTSAWLVVLLFKHALYEQDNGKLLFTNGSDVI